MNVSQVIALTRQWVEENAAQTIGFLGAHLMGALNSMPKEAAFPGYKDVDLHVILEHATQTEPRETLYHGLMLECLFVDQSLYQPAEKVLADPGLAANLAVDSILSDPSGLLTSLHARVAKEYTEPRWIAARCQAEKDTALQGLAALQQASTPTAALWAMMSFVVGLTGLIAVASLRQPTHRRCLVLMRELLAPLGRLDLHEELLSLQGYAHLSRQQVEDFLQDTATVFDRAVQVTRMPVPYQFKLHAHVRPYLVEATQEMIAAGDHREAMGWIAFFIQVANHALQADAPEAEKPIYQARTDSLFTAIGWDTLVNITARLQQAQQLSEKIFKIADCLAGKNNSLK